MAPRKNGGVSPAAAADFACLARAGGDAGDRADRR